MSRRAAADPEDAEGRVVRLGDGRRLGYADYGRGDGRPLIAFHGTPGSRLMLRIARQPARRLGIRLIAPDRPGFGLSDPLPGRRLPDWADDVAALADALAIERFAVVGISGGGPYAIACAYRMPTRLTAVGVVSGLGPLSGAALVRRLGPRYRVALALARHAPWLLRGLTLAARRGWERRPDRLFERLRARMPAADRAIVARPEARAALMIAFREAFRDGGRALAEELRVFARPWGFELAAVEVPVRLWHGDADAVVPLAVARALAAALPHGRLEIRAGAGHYWFFEHIDMLLEAVGGPMPDRHPLTPRDRGTGAAA